jgi:hypothetical protein
MGGKALKHLQQNLEKTTWTEEEKKILKANFSARTKNNFTQATFKKKHFLSIS